jgi:hypothetical protein
LPAVQSPSSAAPARAPAPRSTSAGGGLNGLDARFAAESVDEAYAATTSATLRASIKDMALDGTRVTSIECRTTACKIGFHFDSASHAHELLDKGCIGPQAKWRSLRVACLLLPGAATADGSGDGALFTFRDGKLPQ